MCESHPVQELLPALTVCKESNTDWSVGSRFPNKDFLKFKMFLSSLYHGFLWIPRKSVFSFFLICHFWHLLFSMSTHCMDSIQLCTCFKFFFNSFSLIKMFMSKLFSAVKAKGFKQCLYEVNFIDVHNMTDTTEQVVYKFQK